MLTTLRQRDFALFWFGGLISITGDWVLYAALPFYVYSRTGSTLATTGMIAAELVPSILIGPFAGVFVDRWDRRRTMFVTSLVEGLIVALLLLVSVRGWLWIVYPVATLQSGLAAFFMPAEGALLPTLVSTDKLVPANSLISLNNSLARLAGPSVGGVLLGLAGFPAVVLVDSASFILGAGMIWKVRVTPRPPRNASLSGTTAAWQSFIRDLVGGLSIVRAERSIAILFVVVGFMTFGGTMLDPLYPAFGRDVLHGGPIVFGWLLTAMALGGLLGGGVIGHMGVRIAPGELVGWGSIGAGLLLLLLFNTRWLPLVLALAVVVGVPSAASRIGTQTLIQMRVQDSYRGRVLGLMGASGGLLSLAGASVGGGLAEVFGVIPMLDMAAGLTVLAGVMALATLVHRVSASDSTGSSTSS